MNRGGPVKVLGAGISGLSAALVLARKGIKAVVYEQAQASGMRHTGDFQGFENWSADEDALDFVRGVGWRTDFPNRPFYEVTYYDHRLNAYPVKWNKPLFYLIKRGPYEDTLDTHLSRQAREAGIEIRYGERIAPKSADIVAGGARGNNVAVVGVTFSTRLPDQARSILDDRLAPAGYAYLLVVDGWATIASCFAGPVPKDALMETIKAFEKVANFTVPPDARRFGGVLGFRIRMPEGRGIHIGEAAGFQDYLWGFGMRLAMLSGKMAGEAISGGTDYAAAARAKITPMLKASLVNRYLYEKMGNKGYRAALAKWAGDPLLSEKLKGLYLDYSFKHKLFYFSAYLKHRRHIA